MTNPRQPGLDRREELELRAADGLASSDELAQLRALGVDPAAFAPLRDLLTQALTPASMPDLADAVMAQVDPQAARAHQALAQDLRSALDAGPSPELADDVLMLLDLADDQTGHALRDLLAPRSSQVGAAQLDLADAVLAATHLEDDDLAPALRALLDAGEAPDLSDDVMAALGIADADAVGSHLRQALAAPAAEALVAPPVAVRPVAANSDTTWRFPAIALAAAAALLLFFTGTPSPTSPELLAFELAPINHVDIEELSTGDEVMVQVLQMDENAPTIIYIDELSADDGGMPL